MLKVGSRHSFADFTQSRLQKVLGGSSDNELYGHHQEEAGQDSTGRVHACRLVRCHLALQPTLEAWPLHTDVRDFAGLWPEPNVGR